jgi:hypothetical protein
MSNVLSTLRGSEDVDDSTYEHEESNLSKNAGAEEKVEGKDDENGSRGEDGSEDNI